MFLLNGLMFVDKQAAASIVSKLKEKKSDRKLFPFSCVRKLYSIKKVNSEQTV